MFDSIHFHTTKSSQRLTSRGLKPERLEKEEYNKEALLDSNFVIWGSVDAFRRPPISDFAKQNLYYMQDFDIFHYRFGSFTERKNFRSFLILYTYGGNGILQYRGRKYSLGTGDGFLIDCMEYHMYKVADQIWDTGILHLDGPLLPAFFEQYMRSGTPLFHESANGAFQQYLEQLLQLYDTPTLYRDWQVSTCIDNLLNHLLLLSSKEERECSRIPENIRYLMKYMESNFDQHLTLDYLSDFANVTKYYLSREFKKYTGFSPNDYLISLRIDQAKLLLKNTTLPAVKIAHRVGMHDLNNFTNQFKKKTGMTPIQYRKSGAQF